MALSPARTTVRTFIRTFIRNEYLFDTRSGENGFCIFRQTLGVFIKLAIVGVDMACINGLDHRYGAIIRSYNNKFRARAAG